MRVDWRLGTHRSTALATSLRRYTELPYLIDYLQTGELALKALSGSATTRALMRASFT